MPRPRDIRGDLMYTLEPADENLPSFDVNIEYSMTPIIPAQTYGPPEHCYPAEGGEIEILHCTMEDGTEVELERDWPSEYQHVLELIRDQEA